ncbi:hypothetical protein FM103_15435 [Corynebacterium xerosis]|nr:hypothetical protein FM103_15435 [Corynebacterium xerosis]
MDISATRRCRGGADGPRTGGSAAGPVSRDGPRGGRAGSESGAVDVPVPVAVVIGEERATLWP